MCNWNKHTHWARCRWKAGRSSACWDNWDSTGIASKTKVCPRWMIRIISRKYRHPQSHVLTFTLLWKSLELHLLVFVKLTTFWLWRFKNFFFPKKISKSWCVQFRSPITVHLQHDVKGMYQQLFQKIVFLEIQCTQTLLVETYLQWLHIALYLYLLHLNDGQAGNEPSTKLSSVITHSMQQGKTKQRHARTHAHIFTENTLIRMRAGSRWVTNPTVGHRDKHTLTLTHRHDTWCAIGFVGTWRHKNIYMELIVAVKATR